MKFGQSAGSAAHEADIAARLARRPPRPGSRRNAHRVPGGRSRPANRRTPPHGCWDRPSASPASRRLPAAERSCEAATTGACTTGGGVLLNAEEAPQAEALLGLRRLHELSGIIAGRIGPRIAPRLRLLLLLRVVAATAPGPRRSPGCEQQSQRQYGGGSASGVIGGSMHAGPASIIEPLGNSVSGPRAIPAGPHNRHSRRGSSRA